MSPVLLNPSRFGGGGGGGGGYDAAVLADSPVIYYPLTSGTTSFSPNAGSSSPSLVLDTIGGAGPTAHNSAGPTGGGWLEWSASAGNIHSSTTISGPNHGSFELWFRYAAAPSSDLTLCCFTPNSGGSGDAARLILRSDGKLQLTLWVGSADNLTTSSAQSTGAWHHVVAHWGLSTNRIIRVDKVQQAIGSSSNSAPSSNEAFRLHGRWNGATNAEQTGAVDIAAPAFYATQLSNAQIDAHYDAA